MLPQKILKPGALTIYKDTRKFWMENEMVHTIPFETFQKLSAIDLINAFFLFLLNFAIDANTFFDLPILRLENL